MSENLTVKARYEADVAGYVRAMQTAARETDKAATSADKLAGANQKAADASTRAADRVAAAQDKVRDAQDRAADAAGRLKVAQAKLADARKSGSPTAIVTAEERLATAQRDVESTTRKAAAAQGAYETAVEQAAAAAGQLNGALEDTATKAGTVSEKIAANAASMEQVGTALMGVGGVLVAGFGGAVKTAADFEKAMSSVKAATQETPENLQRMAEAAKRAGADTAYSAEEAAAGIEEMAKAGVETEQIINGGLDGALSLAASGAMEVGDAAELAASAMVQFKLKGEDIPHIADLLAAGAGKAQGSVKDLGDALNQSGLIAAQTGLDIEETTGTLAAFANAGLTGSDAGSSFKTMLQRLNPQSAAAAELMDELGLSAYDAQGNFIGMEAYAGKLQGALSGMSEQQRAATLNTLFGSDAIRAASVLYEEGATGVAEWTEKVNDAGYASKVASDMQDNLAGDLEKLGGAFDTVFLQAGTGANDVLRDMVQGLEGFVDWVGRMPEDALKIGGIMTGLAGGGMLAGGALLTLAPRAMETAQAFRELKTHAPGAAKGLAGVAKYGTLAGVAIAGLQIGGTLISDEHVQSVEDIEQALIRLASASEDARAAELDGVFKQWDTVAGASRTGVEDLAGAVGAIADPSLGDGINENLNFMNGWFNLPDDKITLLKDRVHDLSTTMGEMAASGDIETASQGFRELTEEFAQHGVSAQQVFDQYPGFRDALKGMANDAGVAVTDAELLTWALDGVPPKALAAKEAAEQTASGLGGLGTEAGAASAELGAIANLYTDGMVGIQNAIGAMADETLEFDERLDAVLDSLFQLGVMEQSAAEAAASYEAALDGISAAVEENGRTLDITTEAGRNNQDALFGIADAGRALMTASAEAGASQGELRAQLEGTYDDLVAAGEQMGLTADDARTLAEQILGVPGGVDIETWMDNSAMVMAEATAGAIEAIPGYKGVAIAVSENGTVGSVQEKIDATTGKTVQVWVDDDGSTTTVQQEIRDIAGVQRTVWVDDQGTVYATQQDINAVTGKVVDVKARALTGEALEDLAYAARDRYVNFIGRFLGTSPGQKSTSSHDVAMKDGGVARLPGFAGGGVLGAEKPWKKTPLGSVPGFSSGGRLPYTGLGTDMILGVTSSGMPIARVDDGEMIVRESSTRQYLPALQAINRDDPAVHFLKGFAGGGVPAREWPAVPAFAPNINVTPAEGVDAGTVARMVSMEVASTLGQMRPVWQIGNREFKGLMVAADNFTRGR